MEKSDWVVVDNVSGELAAQVIKSLLESEDIPVLLQPKSGARAYAFSVGYLGEVKILVPPKFAERAKVLLKPEEDP